RSVEGDGLAELFRDAASRTGLRVVGEGRMDPRAKEWKDLLADVAKAKPDAVFFGGELGTNLDSFWDQLHAAVPRARLIGTHDLLSPSFYGNLGDSASSTYLTSVAQDPRQLPAKG